MLTLLEIVKHDIKTNLYFALKCGISCYF